MRIGKESMITTKWVRIWFIATGESNSASNEGWALSYVGRTDVPAGMISRLSRDHIDAVLEFLFLE
jgi:hypothetical protein